MSILQVYIDYCHMYINSKLFTFHTCVSQYVVLPHEAAISVVWHQYDGPHEQLLLSNGLPLTKIHVEQHTGTHSGNNALIMKTNNYLKSINGIQTTLLTTALDLYTSIKWKGNAVYNKGWFYTWMHLYAIEITRDLLTSTYTICIWT